MANQNGSFIVFGVSWVLRTGDTGYIDDDGYVFVLGRSDDVINVAGHRLSTGTLESVIAEHPAVAETLSSG